MVHLLAIAGRVGIDLGRAGALGSGRRTDQGQRPHSLGVRLRQGDPEESTQTFIDRLKALQ